MKKDQLVYGIHPVLEALETGKSMEKVMIQKGLNPDTLHKILPKLKETGTPFQFVPKVKLDKTTGKNHQGIIAMMSPIEFQDLEWLIPSIYESGETPLLLILDRITDVRNFGAICRSAECAGVHAIVIPTKGAAQMNEDAIKTSTGALLRIPICRADSLGSTIDFLNESGFKTIACHEKGKDIYYECDFTTPVAIIMGSEEDGISNNARESSNHSVRIPMLGETQSLNVSVATSILLFEGLRQRSGLK
ncbi:23S rRNA (guanosine(2251)-2'-O)-methyltransferase RlmB [Cryomorpha ignava]|uniref:23S rRNA (Guanosine(2251)-2'-O)-methyltransferase RlmB n=1 Tax=Cryomorpha ignava TaxID=101383 RepID=A0A7K3WP96_9FLAO|nr:23S rRNA (guanosine(2251)-2'-O)-methyltransferase RlmB [Cryomorpha ignava]NEN23483.1 23S rRNA (guanosine(2251)-2'-O)-methyltransferase RlmB [Cryomorpha ignava]